MLIGLKRFHVSINIARMLYVWDGVFLNFSVPESLRYFFLKKGLALSGNCACSSLFERLF